MKKALVITGIVIAVLVVGIVGAGLFMMNQTKKYSPLDTAAFKDSTRNIEVVYCRPFKKDREIFGDLVPYNEVWRTGANEPTTFETSVDLYIQGKTLPAGKYSLWTIPGEGEWQIIFNNEIPGWGVDLSGKAQRNPETDQLVVSASSWQNDKVIEQFTITFDKMDNEIDMIIMWENTTVVMPISL